MKKRFASIIGLAVSAVLLAGGLVGCGAPSNGAGGGSDASGSAGNEATRATTGTINLVTRESGSGTRSAFVELFEVQIANAEGKKVDAIDTSAVETNSTAVMLSTIKDDPRGIGYISLGSLNSDVTALSIDGIAATTDNVKSGSYTVKRPFNIATTNNVSVATQDFINFIFSAEGQQIVNDDHYIAIDENAARFASNAATGEVIIAGSSSVSPVMELLIEGYKSANPNVKVTLQTSDSSTGMSQALDGVCDIGMASRDLKDSETSAGLTSQTIAIDGIAVIVNNNNSHSGLSKEQVAQIFLGQITDWSAL
ncbi:MAG: substrate-binding domain-containing protein [Coriobacteriales bacterium]|nr:substrate-binding domain-containing protein [Coriobacteriales bacterium]